jgi:signal transduction histidine kinase
MPAPIAFVWRWLIFLIGTISAIALIIFIGEISIGATKITVLLKIWGYEFRIYDFVRIVPNVIIGVIIILILISFILLIIEKNHAFDAWLGLFFIFSSIYASVLMINAFLGGEIARVSPILDNPITYIVVFIFDIIILLYTISALIGSKAEIILDLKIFKPIKPDGVLVFLILCKVAYEFGDINLADNKVAGVNAVLLKNVAVFWLFIPLMIIMGLYGIISYGKIKQKRKAEKRIKKQEKAREKARLKQEKERERERKKREKQNQKMKNKK